MHLWFQALSRLHIPQFSSLDDVFPSRLIIWTSLDDVFPSRLIIWRTENFSAARIIPAPNDLAYQKIRHSNDSKKSPRGVHVIYILNGIWWFVVRGRRFLCTYSTVL